MEEKKVIRSSAFVPFATIDNLLKIANNLANQQSRTKNPYGLRAKKKTLYDSILGFGISQTKE
jgi:hypothetical protein